MKIKVSLLIGIFIILITLAANAKAALIMVDRAGGGDVRTIQAGIMAADDGDMVVVTDGIYSGRENTGIVFDGKKITLRSLNGPDHCTIDCENRERAFKFEDNEGANSVLNGFTIKNGKANFGGGIICENTSSPTIRNCQIINCHADEEGGGISCLDGSSPLIKDCQISQCVASDKGGGIFCQGGSSPRLVRVLIINNETESQGGGVYGIDSSPEFEACVIADNSCIDYGGGLCFEDNSLPSLLNCQIGKNVTTGEDSCGGGIFLRHSSPRIIKTKIGYNNSTNGGGVYITGRGQPRLYQCEIFKNTAVFAGMAGGDGGGVTLSETTGLPLVAKCLIRDNTAGTGGGGINCSFPGQSLIYRSSVYGNKALCGGGIEIDAGHSPIIKQSLVYENEAIGWGGGIASESGSDPIIAGCWIRLNRASGAPIPAVPGGGYYWHNGSGGGIICRNDRAQVINSVIANNQATSCGGGIYCYYTDENVPSFRNCTITNNFAPLSGGAIYCWKDALKLNTTFRLTNSIVWNNLTGKYFLGRYLGSICGATRERPLFEIQYSDIEGGLALGMVLIDRAIVDARAIMNLDPEFYDNWHIDDGSPCIDAGDPAEVTPRELDIDMTARIYGDNVDIGADEALFTTLEAGKILQQKVPLPKQRWDAASEILKKSLPSCEELLLRASCNPLPDIFGENTAHWGNLGENLSSLITKPISHKFFK